MQHPQTRIHCMQIIWRYLRNIQWCNEENMWSKLTFRTRKHAFDPTRALRWAKSRIQSSCNSNLEAFLLLALWYHTKVILTMDLCCDWLWMLVAGNQLLGDNGPMWRHQARNQWQKIGQNQLVGPPLCPQFSSIFFIAPVRRIQAMYHLENNFSHLARPVSCGAMQLIPPLASRS